MTDSTIGVAEPGSPTKLLQSYQNTVSSQTVQAEGVVQVDLNGVPVPRGSSTEPIRVDPTGTTTQPISGTLTANQGAAGTTWPVIIKDASGNAIKVLTPIASVGALQAVIYDAFGNSIGSNNIAGQSYLLASVKGGEAPDTQYPNAGLVAVLPAKSTAAAPAYGEGNENPLSTDRSGRLRAVLDSGSVGIGVSQNLLGANDKPDITANQSGNLQTNDENNRKIQERLLLLADLAALNSLIASDNGPGARNYQELR